MVGRQLAYRPVETPVAPFIIQPLVDGEGFTIVKASPHPPSVHHPEGGGFTLTAPQSLVEQAQALSTGTLATLTGYTSYAILEEIQAAFVAFCEKHPRCKNWPAAWRAFQAQRAPRGGKGRVAVQQELAFGFALSEE